MQKIWAREALTPSGWIRDAAIMIDASGRIESVSPEAPPDGRKVDILVPAPANVHSHAFQRAMAGMSERSGPEGRDSFWTWRRLMYRFLDRLTPEDVAAIAALVQMEMLEAGYASVGEFHYLHHQIDGGPYEDVAEMARAIVQAAADTGIGLTLLPVLYEVGGCDGRPLGDGQRRFGSTPDQFARLLEASRNHLSALPEDAEIGVAPHSLRAVTVDGLKAAVEMGGGGPIHMHVAEQIPEIEEVLAVRGARPVEWLASHVDLNQQWCLIHLTHMTSAETRTIAESGAVAGLCPITESNLGDGVFNAIEFRGHGGRLGVGSDSNVRISLSEELRTLEYSQRLARRGRALMTDADSSTGRALLEAASHGGAQALRRASGAIAPGLWADLIALDAGALDMEGKREDLALDAWIFAGDDRLVSDVWSAGRLMVAGGRHVARETIEARYRSTMRRIGEAL